MDSLFARVVDTTLKNLIDIKELANLSDADLESIGREAAWKANSIIRGINKQKEEDELENLYQEDFATGCKT